MRPHVVLSCLAALACVLPTPKAAAQNGLPPGKWTVIIHGRVSGTPFSDPCGYPDTYDELTADMPGSGGWENWVRQIADHIQWLSNSNPGVNIYKMSASTLELEAMPGGTTPDDTTRHHVLMFDWAKTSGIVDAQFLQELFFCDAYTGDDDGFAYAAGEALSATLRHLGADQKVFAMIGYSRGAVVASEVTKRLITANHNPAQVVYLDGEGCNGATCFIYTDGAFDAWIHPTSSPIRFDNIYSPFHERYPQPTHCPSGTDMGGHSRQACRNISIDDQLYAHTPHLGGIIHCIASYDQGGVWDYLINHLNISTGLYTYNSNDEVQEPSVSPSVFSSAGLLFNGDFQWSSIAGWYGNGGGPDPFPYEGQTYLGTFGGTSALSIGQGFSQTHSYFAMPNRQCVIYFDAAKAGFNIHGDNELIISLYSPSLGEVEMEPRLRLADELGETLQTFGPYIIPPAFRGKACSLSFIHAAAGGFNSVVWLDNVTLTPVGPPPDPANPIIVDSSCGNATLGFSGSPPPGVSWFWQGTFCGEPERTDLGSEPTFTAHTIGTYYLKARCDQTGEWSDGCGVVQVTSIGCGPAGDFDCDGTVEWPDFEWFAGCLDGPDNNPPPNCVDTDIDGDSDIDIRDFATLQRNFGRTCTASGAQALIPAGEFMMGNSFASNEGGADELPRHAVYVDTFFMDVTEVTNAQYTAALNWALSQGLVSVISNVVYKFNSGTSVPYCKTRAIAGFSGITWNGTGFVAVVDKQNHPMVEVTWHGAAAFCNWRSAMEGKPLSYDVSTWLCDFNSLGYRLPTEAEWEKAARGGATGRRFPWSDQDTIQHARCNYYSSATHSYDTSPTRGYHPLWGAGGYPGTSPVGFFDGSLRLRADWGWPAAATSYQTANGANGYGLHDMAGNVWEWCNDWYQSNYYSTNPPYINPRGPASGSDRVYRGACWENGAYAYWSRCAARSHLPPASGWFRDRGFRCALGTP